MPRNASSKLPPEPGIDDVIGTAYARKSKLWHELCSMAGPRAKYTCSPADLQALCGGNLHWLVADVMTLYRGVISGGKSDDIADAQAHFGAVEAVAPPPTRVSMRDVGNKLADFCTTFFDNGVQNIIVGMDKGHHSARAMVRILRMSDETDRCTFKPPSPADVEELHAFVNDVYTTLLHPDIENACAAASTVLARTVPQSWLKMVALDATKQDVLQLGLLSLVAHTLLTPPPRGCRLVISGLQRREWLKLATHTLQVRAMYAARVMHLEGWGSAMQAPRGGAWMISVEPGCPLARGLLDGANIVDDETLVQAVFGEQFTYDMCFMCDSTAVLTHQMGTLEMDHALLAFLYNGLAEEMGGVAITSRVGFWTGSDTDAVIGWILNEAGGMLPPNTLLLHTTSAEWSKENITVVSDAHLLAAYLPIVTGLMAGCDTIPSIPKLAHAPYINILPDMSWDPEERVLMYGGAPLMALRKRDTTPGASRPAGIEVRYNYATCAAWLQQVFSTSQLPLEQQRLEAWAPRWRVRSWVWSLEYLANGWRGATFFRERPPPGLTTVHCASRNWHLPPEDTRLRYALASLWGRIVTQLHTVPGAIGYARDAQLGQNFT